MAWEQLSINRPHLAYIILGGFTSLFMLVSLFIKERLYIGEATVATICGVIFGPHAANLFDPRSWGNVDQITLECSRIVLVVQCFAVGVELPKSYMTRHWRSVVFLLLPVMIYGWLVTSVFIWWMVEPLTWLESLCCAACVTATDPVLASSVVGKGKFAKRVPKHLRDLLSAESGCNDGMAFPFIYLSLYLIKYRPDVGEVIEHWAVLTILYECLFGAFYGVAIGYAARHAIKWAENHDMVDRESFLVFYFVLALFCAGSGSILGLDDLLVGFAAGVGFSNDGWFQEKTEESHVSNVIDLLLNLAYFVYFGAIIPWDQFRWPELGLTPWRLVVVAILVILFRRLPIMVVLKPIISDIKTWREALFAGHFGPIGVGAIFIAILARAELQTDSTTPLAQLEGPGSKNYVLIALIWPITTFLVISSILVHGSSIAVFTLGKRINTLTITMSYTQANEDGPSWMNRLPRIQSQSRGSFSVRQPDGDSETPDEKAYPPGTLPFALPGNFLRRQREEEDLSRQGSRTSSLRPPAVRKKRDLEMGPGGPISASAIAPQRRTDSGEQTELSPTREKAENIAEKAQGDGVEAYQEGNEVVVEDEDGNVLDVERAGHQRTMKEEGEHIMSEIKDSAHHVLHPSKDHTGKEHDQLTAGEGKDKSSSQISPRQALKKRFSSGVWTRAKKEEAPPKPREVKRGPALAYQFGNTIIVEDEDGEVVKKFSIPKPQRTTSEVGAAAGPSTEPRQRLQRMGTWAKLSRRDIHQPGESAPTDDDERLRFVTGGRRMSKADFIAQIQRLDPKAQVELINQDHAPPEVKQEASNPMRGAIGIESDEESARPSVDRAAVGADHLQEPDRVARIVSRETEIPTHPVGFDLARFPRGTAAQRRRERALAADEDSDDDGTERVPPVRLRQVDEDGSPGKRAAAGQGETAAERRRREAALGMSSAANERDSDEDEPQRTLGAVPEPARIRFADEPTARRSRHDRAGKK